MMNRYGLTFMRAVYPIDLTDNPHIMRLLKNATSRPAYQRFLQKAEGGLLAMIEAQVPMVNMHMILQLVSWRDGPVWIDRISSI